MNSTSENRFRSIGFKYFKKYKNGNISRHFLLGRGNHALLYLYRSNCWRGKWIAISIPVVSHAGLIILNLFPGIQNIASGFFEQFQIIANIWIAAIRKSPHCHLLAFRRTFVNGRRVIVVTITVVHSDDYWLFSECHHIFISNSKKLSSINSFAAQAVWKYLEFPNN